MKKTLTIITFPLVYYREAMLAGIYQLYAGKQRAELRSRATAGKQVMFSIEQALKTEGDILIGVDDKFVFERTHNEDPDTAEAESFMQSLDVSEKLEKIIPRNRRVSAPECFGYGTLFSERMLLKAGMRDERLSSECATAWNHLLKHVQTLGYSAIEAYIPNVCYKGVCYSTLYFQEKGSVVPIRIQFTEHKSEEIVSVLELKEKSKTSA